MSSSIISKRCRVEGALVVQWITPWTLNREVPGSNLLCNENCDFGQGPYHGVVPWSLLERTYRHGCCGFLLTAAFFVAEQMKLSQNSTFKMCEL